jgi:methyl coenzyme M reductase subunit C
MNGPHDPQDPQDPPDPPEIGTVGEEALKLFGALADMGRQQGIGTGNGLGGLGGLGGLADQAASLAQEVNDHVATGSAECRYCPVCRVVHAVRETSPDVKTHLLTAASSLLQAAAGILESVPTSDQRASQRGPAVEHIDLDADEAPGDDR